MKKHNALSFLAVGVLATVAAVGPACVSQRPSRNGVFNENQYIRKDFLVRAGDGSTTDNGWFLKVTIMETSQPNPLGASVLVPGYEGQTGGWGMLAGGAPLVRFRVTQDKLQMINMKELWQPNDATTKTVRTEEVVNSWTATNVDLKYRINLDGEKTNFYEENQELDWQVRQWVKLNLNKNDLTDLATFGPYYNSIFHMCTMADHATSTMVPNSFRVDEDEDYMEWTVNVTVPYDPYADPSCGSLMSLDDQVNFDLLGRTNISFNLKYSFVRAKPVNTTEYQPLVLDEKDPIQHKYGPIQVLGVSRDQDSGLLAARQMVGRFNPNKPIVYYFEDNVPQWIKDYYTAPGALKDKTNEILAQTGASVRVDFKEWNDGGIERHYGDVRYNFIRWMTGFDNTQAYAGVTNPFSDPRTGELLSADITLNDVPFQDYYVQRIDAYLKSVGASEGINSADPWTEGACSDGETKPVVPSEKAAQHNKNSLYSKFQYYLGRPVETNGTMGPKDFIVQQDADFYKAFYMIQPYMIFADPTYNPYVIPEGGSGVYGIDGATAFIEMARKAAELRTINASIDRGENPVEGITGPDGIERVLQFVNNYRKLMTNQRNFRVAKASLFGRHQDPYEIVSLESMMAKTARKCVDGQWETKEDWAARIKKNYWAEVSWHEFGHAMGLEHNFMGSIDRPNWATDGEGNYTYYTSSIMEYTGNAVRIQDFMGWGSYDEAAIAWIYSNNGYTNAGAKGDSISGQSKSGSTDFTPPWQDPLGFKDDGTEKQFLFCSHQHLQYTPLCRMGDTGVTPSEIVANDLDHYEWLYQWRNFRGYRKFWNVMTYGGDQVELILDMRRFMSLWAFDWAGSSLTDTFRRIGLTQPDPNGSSVQYFAQLNNKFNKEASTANQMSAAFHKAVIQQSAGERPYRTIYDKYYGDTTQQGIILDKIYAMMGWVGLWPTDNYDMNQAGYYISSYASMGDGSFEAVSEDAVASMVGGQYDAFPYFVPYAVSLFAQDTHDPSFNGRIEVRDWIGGFVFTPSPGLLGLLPRPRDPVQDGALRRRVPQHARDLRVRPSAPVGFPQRVRGTGQAHVDLGVRA